MSEQDKKIITLGVLRKFKDDYDTDTITPINNKIDSKTNAQNGEIITTNNDTIGYFKNIKINGNTRYKKSDGTYTDTWESGVSLESMGEKEKNSNGKYPVEIASCGKNLCVKTSANGLVTIESLVGKKLIEGKKYTISSNTSNSYVRVNNSSGTTVYDSNLPCTFTYNNDIVKFEFLNNSSWTWATCTNLQIEEGAIATNYEPYKEDKKTVLLDSPLRKVGAIADVLDLEKMKVTRNCGVKILDGSETWGKESLTRTNTSLFYLSLTSSIFAKVGKCLSDKLSYNYGIYSTDEEGIRIDVNGNLQISILKSKLATDNVTGFKTWLVSNNVTVVYQLATPTTEDIEVSSNTLTDFTTSCTLTIDNTIKGNIECNEIVGLIPSVEEDETRLANLETDNTTNKSNITNLQKSLENKAEKTHNHAISDITNLQTTLDKKAPIDYMSQFEGGAISSNFRKKIIGTTDMCGFVKSFRKNDNTDACMPQYGSGVAWGQADTHGMLCVDYVNPTAYVAGGNGNKLNWYKQLAWKDDLITILFERNNGTINKNINTCFNSTSGTFTAPGAGQYLVMCSGYELSSSSSEYVACVLDSSSSNQNKLYTTGSSGFTLITLNKGQTLAIYTATAGNINSTCISSNSTVNMLIARIK